MQATESEGELVCWTGRTTARAGWAGLSSEVWGLKVEGVFEEVEAEVHESSKPNFGRQPAL